jgi:hypothetical protein
MGGKHVGRGTSQELPAARRAHLTLHSHPRPPTRVKPSGVFGRRSAVNRAGRGSPRASRHAPAATVHLARCKIAWRVSRGPRVEGLRRFSTPPTRMPERAGTSASRREARPRGSHYQPSVRAYASTSCHSLCGSPAAQQQMCRAEGAADDRAWASPTTTTDPGVLLLRCSTTGGLATYLGHGVSSFSNASRVPKWTWPREAARYTTCAGVSLRRSDPRGSVRTSVSMCALG